MKFFAEDMFGNNIEVTDKNEAIAECELGLTSPYKIQAFYFVRRNRSRLKNKKLSTKTPN